MTREGREGRNRSSKEIEKEWAGKRVVVLGLARQGKALIRYFVEHGADVVVSDSKPAEALKEETEELGNLSVDFVFGGHPPALLEGANLLCLSGGVPADLPLAQQAREQGIPLSNDAQLFLERCPASVIGITGSAGKTTTTTLVGRMASAEYQESEKYVWVGGNIGRPLLADLPTIQTQDLVVMELSSFQLELMDISPQIAVILNVTPNHLDRHKTMVAYTAAKRRILQYQLPDDLAVLNRDDEISWALKDQVRGRLISFGWEIPEGEGTYLAEDVIRLRLNGKDSALCPVEAVALRGRHNLLNVIAACAIAAVAEISPEAMQAGVRGFQGVEHRLEFVRRIDGVDWYNDSIATAPERAIAAIHSFDEPLVLLSGGRDKDLSWDAYAELVCSRVRHLILFGEAVEKIANAIEEHRQAGCELQVEICADLDQAVAAAARVAEAGDLVLLAPGGTSYDAFQDFAERGERYRELVNSL